MMDAWVGGWMDWSLTSFSTIFQSYHDDGRVIMKGYVMKHLLDSERIFEPDLKIP